MAWQKHEAKRDCPVMRMDSYLLSLNSLAAFFEA